MAAQHRGTVSGGNYSSTSISLVRPAGVVAGDWLYAIRNADQGGFQAPGVGWEVLSTSPVSSGSSTQVLRREVTAESNPGSYTFAKQADSDQIIVVVAVSGSDGLTAPVLAFSSGAHTAPSVTPPNAGSLLLCSAEVYDGSGGITGGWTPPAGMTERADVNVDGYNALTVASQELSTTAATGTRTFTSAFSGSQTAGMVSLVVPAATVTGPPAHSGSMGRTGSGSLSFAATKTTVNGTLSRTGSGSLAFPSRSVAVPGSLARTGSGSLGLVGKLVSAGSLARTGSGQLDLLSGRPGAAGALALSGSGELALYAGATTGFGTLARTGSGALVLSSGDVQVAGTLARTGTGALVLYAGSTVGAGSLARTGLGTLVFTPLGVTSKLLGWDPDTQTWRAVVARAWDSTQGAWRLAKGFRRKNGSWS